VVAHAVAQFKRSEMKDSFKHEEAGPAARIKMHFPKKFPENEAEPVPAKSKVHGIPTYEHQTCFPKAMPVRPDVV